MGLFSINTAAFSANSRGLETLSGRIHFSLKAQALTLYIYIYFGLFVQTDPRHLSGYRADYVWTGRERERKRKKERGQERCSVSYRKV